MKHGWSCYVFPKLILAFRQGWQRVILATLHLYWPYVMTAGNLVLLGYSFWCLPANPSRCSHTFHRPQGTWWRPLPSDKAALHQGWWATCVHGALPCSAGSDRGTAYQDPPDRGRTNFCPVIFYTFLRFLSVQIYTFLRFSPSFSAKMSIFSLFFFL